MKLCKFILISIISLCLAIGFTTTFAAEQPKSNKSQSTKSKTQAVEVVFFSASWCRYCTHLREYLTAHGIKYTEYDIEQSVSGYKEYKDLGGKGIPLIRVGDTVLHGFNKRSLEQTLLAAGINMKN